VLENVGRALVYIGVWETYRETRKRVRAGAPGVILAAAFAAVVTSPVWLPLAVFLTLGTWYTFQAIWVFL
jgi:hypothetical protein